jgi:tetratricopeptide (TPR) repeat protein/O-antigen ligase
MNKLKTILFYLIIAALFTPFLVDTATYFPFIIAKVTAFRLIVEAILVVWVFWLFKSRTSKENFISLTPLVKTILIFGVILFISALLGVDFSFSLFSGNERMEGVFGIWHFIIFFLALATTFDYLKIEKILKIQIGVGILYSVVAILAYFGIGKITAQMTGNRLAGYSGNPSFFATYLIFNAFLALYFYFRQYIFDKKLFNWWLLVFLGQSLLIFGTLTRGVMIGYLISIVLIAFGIIFLKTSFKEKSDLFIPFKKISIVFLISILVFSVFTFAAKNTDLVKNNLILSRFSSISLTDPTALSRLFSAGTAWKSFLQKPLFGWGPENYEAAYTTNFNPEVLKYLPEDFYFDRVHNKPMEVLATNGIFGFLFYFLNCLRKNKEWFLPSLVLAGCLIGYFIQNIFIFDFHESYLMFFLLLAFISSLYHYSQEPILNRHSGLSDQESFMDKDSKDYTSKMGRGLLIITIICLVIFSMTRYVIKPYLVSKGIFNVGYFVKQGESEKAYKELKKIINDPAFLEDDIILGMKKMYSLYSFKISEEYKEKIINELVFKAKEASEKRPWLFNLISAKADLETIFSQWDENGLKYAEKSTEEMLSRFPYFPQSHLFASKFYLLNEEIEKAIEEAEKVISVNPQISTSYYILAFAYDGLGDIEQRDENLIKAAELGFPFKDKAQILNVINLCVKDKKYETIANLYLQAMQIDPQEISLYTGLAATYGKMHNKEGAIYYAKKAAELNPDFKQASEDFIKIIENEEWDKISD